MVLKTLLLILEKLERILQMEVRKKFRLDVKIVRSLCYYLPIKIGLKPHFVFEYFWTFMLLNLFEL